MPTISRLENLWEPICRSSSTVHPFDRIEQLLVSAQLAVGHAVHLSLTRIDITTSPYERDDFQTVALGQAMLGMTLPGHKFEIDLDRHRLAAELQLVQQLGDGCAFGDLAGLAVNGQLHVRCN